MRRRTKALLVAALFAAALALPVFGAAAPMEGTPIGAQGTTLATYAWSPEHSEVELGGTVMFGNGTDRYHGLNWTTAPAKLPECAFTVPVDTTDKEWFGPCRFVQPGTFNFVCFAHPSMTGYVTVPATGIPLATTQSASGVGDTTANVKGLVNPHGEETKWWVEYGTTIGYGSKTPELTVAGTGTTDVAESAGLSSLATGTVYHYRIVAKNSAGESKGEDNSFQTTGAPLVTTEAATLVTKTEARLHATVNPNGHQTTFFFEYGTTTGYGSKSASKLAGSGTTPVAGAIPIGSLSPGTTYHYRVVGTNSGGTSPGNDLTFTTTASGTPPPPEETPRTEAETGPAFGSAKVSAAKKGVKVSIQVLAPGAGGRLQISLSTKAKKPAGALTRSGVGAGPLTLSVPLNAKAKKALRQKHKLPLTAKISLTGSSGTPTTVTKSVVVH